MYSVLHFVLLTSQFLLSFVLLSSCLPPSLPPFLPFLSFFSLFHLFYSDARSLKLTVSMKAGPLYYLLVEIT